MIDEVNDACKKLNKGLGVPVSPPNPGEKALGRASAVNVVLGIGLVAVGALSSLKWCAVLGIAAIGSSAVMAWESKRRRDG